MATLTSLLEKKQLIKSKLFYVHLAYKIGLITTQVYNERKLHFEICLDDIIHEINSLH